MEVTAIIEPEAKVQMQETCYGQEFYASQILGSLQSAQVYLYHLFSIWGVPESVADLGCGRGAWLATCRDLGVRWTVGFDGSWNSQGDMLDQGIEFHPTDLEKALPLADRFDLVISLEVAEHLQPESSDIFVESLSRLSDAVLFGAAFIGQPGANHINTRLHSFWAEKFFERGYVVFDLFRPVFWDDERVEPCYRQNTFLYVKPDHSLYRALVHGGYEYRRDTQFMDCVHPAVYLGLLNEFLKLQQLREESNRDIPLQKLPDPGDTSDVPSEPESANFMTPEVQGLAGNLEGAAETCRQVLAREPNNPEYLLRLSHILLRMKCYQESLHHARHFLRIVDDISFGHYIAGHATRELGRWRESRSYLLRAVELDPSNVFTRVLCCMSAFTVCMDQAEAVAMLRTYAEELEALICGTPLDTAVQIDNAAEGVGALAPFFLPYLGCDVKAFQAKYGTWVCSVMAARYPRFTHALPQRSSGGMIKIGIVSHYFHNHSNWKIPIRGWLEHLDRDRFSIHCFYTGEISDTATESARLLADSFLQSSDIETVATTIHEQQFDVLIYPGTGMDTVTLKLAALRLAPVQCSSWGHPVTTGMPTVDYFLSSDLMEPSDGDLHYSEKLVRLPNLSIWYEPAEPGIDVPSDFAIPGVGQDDVIFLCCQNLLKYLPQYDFVFPAIAERVGNASFVFIANQISELTDKFKERLDLVFNSRGLNASDHVSFVPPLNCADFAALNARADIFLDSIEWSGCNTVFESLPFDKPVVTLPGTFMRGRHAYGILKMMGINETIAASVEDYVSIAVQLATDIQWRKEISNKIYLNKHKLYRDRECMTGLGLFLENAVGRGPHLDLPADTIPDAAQSDDAEVWLHLGSSYVKEGKYSDAEAAYHRAIGLKPDYSEAYINRGNLFYALGRIGEAEAAYRQAITINPGYDKAFYNLGVLLYGLERLEEAEEAYQQAIISNPRHDKAYYNLGFLLNRLGRLNEARAAYIKLINIAPDSAETYYNLGDVLLNLGHPEEAAAAYQHAVTLKPEYAEAHNSLGTAIGLLGDLDQAQAAFRQAISCNPEFALAHSNLLLTLQYINSVSHEEAFAEALNFGRCFEEQAKVRNDRHANLRDPGKRLKVGIVSGNLCEHPVGYFLEAALRCLDKGSIALYAYANQLENDGLSERLRENFEEWLLVKKMSDEDLSSRIASDGIDILIDLGGHTAGNRLLTFIHRPAPVQMTWLGYPNTTGLYSMDYILADPITLPVSEEGFYTEKPWRLPDTYICFTPPRFELAVNQLPALENGYVTFGCFNNPVKLTDETIACWAQILHSVPDSMLLLRLRQHLDRAGSQRDLLEKSFLKYGIDPTRLRLEGAVGTRCDLIASYHRIDIGLDPFPYNGTTTTCEAAWMGVPTLTLKMARGIYSYNGELIMKSVGLADWVADSVEGYVEAARKVTLDIPQLAQIRTGLRDKLLQSPLCDAPKFANNLQSALRGMWQQWCIQNREDDTVCLQPVKKTKKLHIGGTVRVEGWEVFSIEEGTHVDHVGNAKDLSRFADNTFSEIYASHVLEHFDYVEELQETLVEWNRVLTPGGLLNISVPDLDVLARLYLEKDRQNFEERFLLMRMMFGGHTTKHDYHAVGLNEEMLLHYLKNADFINPKKCAKFEVFQDTSSLKFKGEFISLNIVAEKIKRAKSN